MKAKELLHQRIILGESCFAELVLWLLPAPLAGSSHSYKYRLAYVVNERCVLRYDNEAGKGDHRHVGTAEESYQFTSVDQLVADFQSDIRRWNHENGHS